MPSRDAIMSALDEAARCLRPGGRIVCLGPDIRYAGGAYWDFFDHIVPLTARSLAEALEIAGLRPVEVIDRFLPFTLAGKPAPAPWLIRGYLKVRPAWRRHRQAVPGRRREARRRSRLGPVRRRSGPGAR